MSDISLAWDQAKARGDWSVVNGGLATGNDLATAILVSLFTDRRLPSDQAPPDGSDDPRGCWIDTYEEQPTGSLLWTLERVAVSNGPAFLAQVEQMTRDALQWLLDDQVAASVQITTWWITTSYVGIAVTVKEPNGTSQSFKYSWAWKGVG
jgi:phage gp46-like protein